MEPEITSSLFGPFDPTHPVDLEGRLAHTLAAPPVTIDAPASVVWGILADFDRYPEWNPLVRFLRLETRAAVNEWVTLGYTFELPRSDGSLPPHQGVRRERLTVWEPGVCLSYADVAVVYANERTQYLRVDGPERCTYFTFERFSGAFTPLIRALYGAKIVGAFRRSGLALKTRAEQRPSG